MNVTLAAPPKMPEKGSRSLTNRSYNDLFQVLRSNAGSWVQIDPNEVAGTDAGDKQTAIGQAAKKRKVQVQTTYQQGMIYVRLTGPLQGTSHA